MSFRDDDDELFLSPSNPDAFQNREQAKEKAKEKKAKQKGKLLALKRMFLRGQIEEEGEEKPHEPPDTFGTKTHMQMEDAEVLDGQKQFTPDDLVEESKKEEAKKKEEEEERANEDV